MRMQTIKGIIALLLATVFVFTAVEIFNSKAEAGYIARLKNTIVANPVGMAKAAPAGAATNVVNQARQKIKNVNL